MVREKSAPVPAKTIPALKRIAAEHVSAAKKAARSIAAPGLSGTRPLAISRGCGLSGTRRSLTRLR